MPQLFVLPHQVPLSSSGGLLAGAKLTFTATGTTTPQNTYSDIALTVANANPVVADASGVFGAIYLDPSLPNYRVKLTTSANVLVYQQDDVPSNQNTSQQFRLKATAPSLTFEETDASANNKIWRLKVNGEQLLLTILNDAEAVETTVFAFDRTGTTPDQLNFTNQYLRVGGVLVATQADVTTALVTLTGVNSTVTGNATISRTGTKVAIKLPALSGTSNATSMSITGLGTSNLSSGGIVLCRVTDNGTTQVGIASFGTTSITFSLGASGGLFTNTGTKGIPAQLLVFDTDLGNIA
jgi:hypothetical protein